MKKQTNCQFEPLITRHLKAGSLSDELTLHLQSCDSCLATVKIIRFFKHQSALEFVPKLPTAGLIWWKSKLRERESANQKITQPLFIMQNVGILLASLTIFGIFILRPAYLLPVAAVINQTFNVVVQMADYLLVSISILFVFAVITLYSMRNFEKHR